MAEKKAAKEPTMTKEQAEAIVAQHAGKQYEEKPVALTEAEKVVASEKASD